MAKKPRLSPLAEFLEQQLYLKALNTEQTVEKGLIPIYQYKEYKKTAYQIASGILLNLKDEFFVLTASHVFDEIGSAPLLTGVGFGTPVESLAGERYCLGNGVPGNHQSDNIDACVYHISSSMSDELKEKAITFNNLDLSVDNNTSMYLSCGIRIKKSNTTGGAIRCKAEAFPSCEIKREYYEVLKKDRELHIALLHNDKWFINGSWQCSPQPKGFSGGGIVRIDGLSCNPSIINENKELRQVLTGIITDHRREKNGCPGTIIGTKITAHLALINQDFPDLFSNTGYSPFMLDQSRFKIY